MAPTCPRVVACRCSEGGRRISGALRTAWLLTAVIHARPVRHLRLTSGFRHLGSTDPISPQLCWPCPLLVIAGAGSPFADVVDMLDSKPPLCASALMTPWLAMALALILSACGDGALRSQQVETEAPVGPPLQGVAGDHERSTLSGDADETDRPVKHPTSDPAGQSPAADGAGAVDAPPPPPAPIALEIHEPARGHRIAGPTLQIVGQLTGGQAPQLTVNGDLVVPGPDGLFSAEVSVEPGLHVLVVRAQEGEEIQEDRRGILVDADVEPTAPVENGLRADISPAGLTALSGLVAEYAQNIDLGSMVGGDDDMRIESVSYSGVDLTFEPRAGHFMVRLVVRGLRIQVRAEVDMIFSVTVSGEAWADEAVITAELRPTIPPNGSLDLSLSNASVELRGFGYNINNFPGFLESIFEDMVREKAEDALRDALSEQVLDQLFDPESLNQSLDILGRTIEIDLRLSTIDVQPQGMTINLDGEVRPSEIIHEGAAVRPRAGDPSPSDAQLDLAFHEGFIDRLLHAVWAGGVLDATVGAGGDVELPDNIGIGLLLPALGPAGEGIDPATPLIIGLRPLHPPVAHTQPGAFPLVIEMADLMIDIAVPEGPMVSLAAHLVAQTGLEVPEDGLAIAPTFEVEVHCDVAETPRGPVNNPRLEAMIGALIQGLPGMIGDETFRLAPEALPVGVGFAAPRFEADALAPWFHLLADLQ